MKSPIILLTSVFLFSCGQSTEFELQKTTIQFIQNLDKTNSSLDYLFKGDSIIENSIAGVILSFDVDYIGNGGSQEPGNKGTKDSIIEVKVIISKNGKELNITDKLSNSLSNKISTYEYNTSFKDMKDFKNSFNNLHIEKREKLKYKDLEKLRTGFDLESNDYIFWIQKKLSKQLSKNDTIKIKINLSNNKELNDYIVLK